MTQVQKALGIDSAQRRDLANQAERWIEEHAPTLMSIKSNEGSAIVDEKLTPFLYKANKLMFNDFRSDQISSIIGAVVQRLLSNRRRAELRRAKKAKKSSLNDQSFTVTRKVVKVQRTPSASESPQSQEAMSFTRTPEDFGLCATMSSHRT